MPIDVAQFEAALRAAIPLTALEIEDQSSGCGESFAVVLVSEVFEGKGTLARHRMVNQLLKPWIAQMHAFSQKTYTPQQYEKLKDS
ncbi:bola-like protein [Coprinellus micaceus]|uniref:Bola-like protein n=1 Tax=Coprinellus micaceus TaxID=71717 RepID=A0A4Y7SKP1_COPMI|nr:bola-like protein [Coprinellus micaceus]